MGIAAEFPLGNHAAIQLQQSPARRQPLVAGMTSMLERLPPCLVPGQQPGNGAGIAFPPALKQGQGTVAMAEEAQHRRHAVARIEQRMRRLDIHRRQCIHHHHQMAIGMEQRFRRAADMAAVRQNLARDLLLQTLQAGVQPLGGIVHADTGQRQRRRRFEA